MTLGIKLVKIRQKSLVKDNERESSFYFMPSERVCHRLRANLGHSKSEVHPGIEKPNGYLTALRPKVAMLVTSH